MIDSRFARAGDHGEESAPDTMSVAKLIDGDRGGLAVFSLPSHTTGRAVRHRTVEELWLFTAGRGEMSVGGQVEAVERGVAVRIAPGEVFQVRSFEDGVQAVAATMPPWPGAEEAEIVAGPWPPSEPEGPATG